MGRAQAINLFSRKRAQPYTEHTNVNSVCVEGGWGRRQQGDPHQLIRENRGRVGRTAVLIHTPGPGSPS